MESRMDKIFQAYIDNEISLDEICTKFNITSWDFFNKLANFCNLHFVDLDEDNDFIYEGIPFSLLLKFKFLLIKCRRKNKISIWKNKTSIKVEILFFYKP